MINAGKKLEEENLKIPRLFGLSSGWCKNHKTGRVRCPFQTRNDVITTMMTKWQMVSILKDRSVSILKVQLVEPTKQITWIVLSGVGERCLPRSRFLQRMQKDPVGAVNRVWSGFLLSWTQWWLCRLWSLRQVLMRDCSTLQAPHYSSQEVRWAWRRRMNYKNI